MTSKHPLIAAACALGLAILACSVPTTAQQPPAAVPVPTDTGAPPAETPAAVEHKDKPGEAPAGGETYYDADSKSTASMGYAPFGEIYKFNRFERPFKKDTRGYLPEVDIQKFRMTKDASWQYAVFNLIGPVPTDSSAPDYGIEIDLDLDGRGDVLIWAKAPFTTEWTNTSLQVYEDPNNDVGGPSPVAADPPPGGNGYEKLILENEKGEDPDLAWVRISPQDGTVMQFAFKRSVAAGVKGILWNVWADEGLRDVTKFNYNDHFTKAEAGMALQNDPDFPPKQLFAMDNTCRLAFDFIPTGYEPLLCPPIVQPIPTGTPRPRPSSPPPTDTPVIIF